MPLTRACDHCGTQYSRPASLAGKYCSKRCAYADRRKETTTHRRIRVAPTHPLAGKTGLVSESRVVLYSKIGPGPHPCHWCAVSVNWSTGHPGYRAGDLVADHVDGDPLNDSAENLVAACGPCNGTRARAVRDGEVSLVRKNGTRLRAAPRACEFCGGEFLVAPSQMKCGKGRFCSRSCARRAPRHPSSSRR